MNDKLTSKVLWWLGSLIALLAILLANSLQWISTGDYNNLLLIIPYKWQLTIWLMIIISMLIAFLYTKAFPKSSATTSQQTQNNETVLEQLTPRQIYYRLNGLTENEKNLMRRFYQEDTRTLKLSLRNPTADSLRSIDILEITSLVSSTKGVSYTVKPIYWDYMKKRPDVIGLDE